MLDDLKFVQGAVAKKDFSPELTHFNIKNGFIRGFNGRLSLCSPIALDIEAKPKALPFINAIQSCKGTVALSITKAGRLSIKSGSFRAYVECLEDEFPTINPEGDRIELASAFLQNLTTVSKFIGEDASRQWATGVLFKGQSAFATNNIILCEQWLDNCFPIEVNLPVTAIKEMLRVKHEPIALQTTEKSLTFHFEGNRWLRTNIYDLKWPDISKVLDVPSSPVKLEDSFFDALETLKPFTDDMDRVFFDNGNIKTAQDENTGAIVESVVDAETGCFQLTQLLKLKGLVDSIDFSLYPKPCPFFGDNIRGAIVGMRL